MECARNGSDVMEKEKGWEIEGKGTERERDEKKKRRKWGNCWTRIREGKRRWKEKRELEKNLPFKNLGQVLALLSSLSIFSPYLSLSVWLFFSWIYRLFLLVKTSSKIISTTEESIQGEEHSFLSLRILRLRKDSSSSQKRKKDEEKRMAGVEREEEERRLFQKREGGRERRERWRKGGGKRMRWSRNHHHLYPFFPSKILHLFLLFFSSSFLPTSFTLHLPTWNLLKTSDEVQGSLSILPKRKGRIVHWGVSSESAPYFSWNQMLLERKETKVGKAVKQVEREGPQMTEVKHVISSPSLPYLSYFFFRSLLTNTVSLAWLTLS